MEEREKIFGVDVEEYKETKCKLLLLFGLTELIQFTANVIWVEETLLNSFELNYRVSTTVSQPEKKKCCV